MGDVPDNDEMESDLLCISTFISGELIETDLPILPLAAELNDPLRRERVVR